MTGDMLVSLLNLTLNQYLLFSPSFAGSSSSFSSYLNFHNCSFPREQASVYANYLRSHFSVFHPNSLPSRARGYPPEFLLATYLEKCFASFYYPFSSTEFLTAATNFCLFTATGQVKVAYPMLEYLPRLGMNSLLHILNFF